jgi:hypothetical protein
MMLLNRLNSLEEQERTGRRRSRLINSDDIQQEKSASSRRTPPHADMNAVQEEEEEEEKFEITRNYGIIAKDLFYVLLYFLFGILFYHYNEGWGVVKCSYFIVVSSKCDMPSCNLYITHIFCSDNCRLWRCSSNE